MLLSDISEETKLELTPCGFNLIEPGLHNKRNTPKSGVKELTLSYLLNLPLSVYVYNIDNEFIQSNDINAELIQCDSKEQALGKSLNKIIRGHEYDLTAKNHLSLLKNKTYKILEEIFTFSNALFVHGISIKAPCYNVEGKYCAILGLSLIFGRPDFFSSLQTLCALGFLNAENFLQKRMIVDQVHLTKRESDIVPYIVHGKSAKEIARSFNLSHRTIEHYLEALKNKLNVDNKYKLIDKLIAYCRCKHCSPNKSPIQTNWLSKKNSAFT